MNQLRMYGEVVECQTVPVDGAPGVLVRGFPMKDLPGTRKGWVVDDLMNRISVPKDVGARVWLVGVPTATSDSVDLIALRPQLPEAVFEQLQLLFASLLLLSASLNRSCAVSEAERTVLEFGQIAPALEPQELCWIFFQLACGSTGDSLIVPGAIFDGESLIYRWHAQVAGS